MNSLLWSYSLVIRSLFRNKRFVVNGLREMLQSLPYLMFQKPISCNFEYYLVNALVYRPGLGIYKVKLKVAQNEKLKKTTWVFWCIKYSKGSARLHFSLTWTDPFEAFRKGIKLSTNLLFLKNVLIDHRWLDV